MDNKKIIIYQIFTRLFGNRNLTRKEWGTVAENGCGKMNDIDERVLGQIRGLGITHVWYTGVIRHATQTDYSEYGIPRQHPAVVKGKAGSPYAITDYYDIDPDLSVNVRRRMSEFDALVRRTHKAGMKVLIDFVPNHVARQYLSIKKPKGVKDLGENDDKGMAFSPRNNFYYCPGQPFEPYLDLSHGAEEPYSETPAKATGNDRFDNRPGVNDWYETVKLNYGVDYHYYGGRREVFDPVPDTWKKMTDILLFWAGKGVDGFRCDMAEMVPAAFWHYATSVVKEKYPELLFIGEVYAPSQYRNYIANGFDYLYDKVGMYDCIRGISTGSQPASSITYQWQSTDDINSHMLFFLENHDEQRAASDFFCGDALKAVPGLIVSTLMRSNPFMLYAGEEYGERGMDKEGFSGRDGRSTIFDYWALDSVCKGYYDRKRLSKEERLLGLIHTRVLNIANRERTVSEGEFFDLMYVNPASDKFNPHRHYAFLRRKEYEMLLVAVNFSGEPCQCEVCIPEHAFDCFKMPEKKVEATDLLTGERTEVELKRNGFFPVSMKPYGGRVYKFDIKMEDKGYSLNVHNKEEFPPAHTAEHLLNQTMVRLFGCERSNNAHIERKKSKISYVLDHKPSRKEEKAIEDKMNELIAADLPVTFEYVDINHLPDGIKADRLPDDVSETIRLVHIGDYDVCPCIGKHVRSTSQIGKFVLLGTNWDELQHTFRIRYKVV